MVAMQNFAVLAIVVLILVSAVLYIRKEKKKGIQCIGCPDAATCPGNCPCCSSNCSCPTGELLLFWIINLSIIIQYYILT